MGQPVSLVKRQTSSRDFVRWRHYFQKLEEREAAKARDEINRPTRDHYYFAEIIAWLQVAATHEPTSRSDCLIKFTMGDEHVEPALTEEELEEREAAELRERNLAAKARVFSVLGTPENFEGWD